MRSIGQWFIHLLVLVCVLTLIVTYLPQATIWAGIRVDGGYTEWSAWKQCAVSCGLDGAIETRFRRCTNPEPNWLGFDCLILGVDVEQRECPQVVPCPVDGGFSDWLQWGACDKTCEGGKTTRFRFCNNPMPLYRGKSCEGPHEEAGTCNNDIKCPINGGYSEWTPFTQCSVNCKTERFRRCDHPEPAHGGQPCQGPSHEEHDCKDGLCKIDGGYSQWAGSECNVSCGKGQVYRSRTCTNPAPQNGGKNCEGPEKEVVECVQPSCPTVHQNSSVP